MKKTALLFIAVGVILCASVPVFPEQNAEEFVIHHLVNNRTVWHPLPFISVPLIQDFKVKDIDMSVSLHVLMLGIAALMLFLLFVVFYRKKSGEAPKGLTNMLEMMVVFVRDEICVSFLGEKDGRRLAPIFLNLFFFILVVNFMGLVPFFGTATANVNVTAALAVITLLMMVLGGLIKNGPIGFFKLFMPPGVPLPMYVVVFPLEILGLFTRPLALTLRLFANMLAGHLVIMSFLSLLIKFQWVGLPFIIMVLFIYMLEVLVSVLQAYIFTMLSAIFVGSMMHPQH